MRRRTRSTYRRKPRYKGSTTAAQLIYGIRLLLVSGQSLNAAVRLTNSRSGALAKERLLTRTTLYRYSRALPPELVESPNEVSLLAWIQEYDVERQVSRSVKQGDTQRLFTMVKEELLAQWICVMASVNLAVGRDAIITRARELLLDRPGITPQRAEYVKQLKMRGWWERYIKRQAGLSRRREELVTPARLMAQTQVGNITSFFKLLSQFKDYTAAQIYAGDETGISGNGQRPGLVFTLKGAPRVQRGKKRVQGHIGLLHIGNALGESCDPAVVFKGDKLTADHLTGLPLVHWWVRRRTATLSVSTSSVCWSTSSNTQSGREGFMTVRKRRNHGFYSLWMVPPVTPV